MWTVHPEKRGPCWRFGIINFVILMIWHYRWTHLSITWLCSDQAKNRCLLLIPNLSQSKFSLMDNNALLFSQPWHWGCDLIVIGEKTFRPFFRHTILGYGIYSIPINFGILYSDTPCTYHICMWNETLLTHFNGLFHKVLAPHKRQHILHLHL